MLSREQIKVSSDQTLKNEFTKVISIEIDPNKKKNWNIYMLAIKQELIERKKNEKRA